MKKNAVGKGRLRQQLEKQYEVEKALAQRLRQSTAEERKLLYKVVYDELYQTIQDHPQVLRKSGFDERQKEIASQLAVLKRFLERRTRFLEIGAGDCALCLKIAEFVRKVYAVDVSDVLTKDVRSPQNLRLIVCDARSLAIPSGSVDLAYSYQVMEHLHPEDAVAQLAEIRRVLASGGNYLCITPNRLGGPWDVSRYFDTEATGLHLKEYTNSELADAIRRAGFRRVRVYVRAKGLHLLLPVWPVSLLESVLSILPARFRRTVGNWYPVRIALGVNLLATK